MNVTAPPFNPMVSSGAQSQSTMTTGRMYLSQTQSSGQMSLGHMPPSPQHVFSDANAVRDQMMLAAATVPTQLFGQASSAYNTSPEMMSSFEHLRLSQQVQQLPNPSASEFYPRTPINQAIVATNDPQKLRSMYPQANVVQGNEAYSGGYSVAQQRSSPVLYSRSSQQIMAQQQQLQPPRGPPYQAFVQQNVNSTGFMHHQAQMPTSSASDGRLLVSGHDMAVAAAALHLQHQNSPQHQQFATNSKLSGGGYNNNGAGSAMIHHDLSEVALPLYDGQAPYVRDLTAEDFLPGFFPIGTNTATYSVRHDMLRRHRALHYGLFPVPPPNDLPSIVENRYQGLCPLESVPGQLSQSLPGLQTSCYKAVDKFDHQVYCLCRVHNFIVSNAESFGAWKNIWKKIRHPNIVQLRSVFVTRNFGDSSLVLVYDFHPLAETLPRYLQWLQKTRKTGTQSGAQPLLKESQLWSFIIQIASALYTLHTNNLACRSLFTSKILVYSKSRVRINWLGVLDFIEGRSQLTAQGSLGHSDAERQVDMRLFANIVLHLAYGQPIDEENRAEALEAVRRSYSDQFYNFVNALCFENVRVEQFHSYIGSKFFAQFDSVLKEYDYLEDELGKEIHDGRLFRLISKLGMICDRPHLGKDTTWSETGDRYQLKLFRDYLFHQVTSDGQPWIDMGHIVVSLNKLDAGIQEPICLVSSDERIVLIQTYAELKQCLRRSWHDLLQCAHPGINNNVNSNAGSYGQGGGSGGGYQNFQGGSSRSGGGMVIGSTATGQLDSQSGMLG